MKCKRCGQVIKMTRAIKSRVRLGDFEYKCKCGCWTIVTQADVDASNEVKFDRLERQMKHGCHT